MGTHKHYGMLPSSLLALKQHNPGTFANYSTTSTTAVDADATNLAITFAAPASGRVLVRLSAVMTQITADVGSYWHIREGGTVVATRWTYFYAPGGSSSDLAACVAFEIAGLTPGSSHTYTWAHSTGEGGTARLYAGGFVGPAVMEVHAA